MTQAYIVDRPSVCSFCGDGPFTQDHWYWMKDQRYRAGGKWRCRERKKARAREYMDRKRQDSVRGPQHKEYAAQYAKDHARYFRYKSYRSIDNRKYGGGTLSWDLANRLMEQPCNYCGLSVSEGLDRIVSSKGHTIDNVLPCCAVCNTILIDLPMHVKENLASGLRRSREEGDLDRWVPPRFRK